MTHNKRSPLSKIAVMHTTGIALFLIAIVLSASLPKESPGAEAATAAAVILILGFVFIGIPVTLAPLFRSSKSRQEPTPPVPRSSRVSRSTTAASARVASGEAERPSRASVMPTPLPPYPLPARAATQEVEGEFARTENIVRAMGRKPARDEDFVLEGLPCELRTEPTNRYDQRAVMVIVRGYHVGYLPREDAGIYFEILDRIETAGYAPTTKARIWATTRLDWSTNKQKIKARVTVALSNLNELLPSNDPPRAPYSLLPRGRAVQVSGEENHLPTISEHLDASGDGFTIGTLVAAKTVTVRAAPKDIVEVHIDGDIVGTLTPAMSEHFLPTIAHLAEQGLLTAVWLRVKGSPIAAQITVLAMKAHEIPSEWFGEPTTIPRLSSIPADSSDLSDDLESIRGERPEPMWDE